MTKLLKTFRNLIVIKVVSGHLEWFWTRVYSFIYYRYISMINFLRYVSSYGKEWFDFLTAK